MVGEFPGGPGGKTLASSAGSGGLGPGWGAEISHDSWPKKQNIKKKKGNTTASSITLKMIHIKKQKTKNELMETGLICQLKSLDLRGATKWARKIHIQVCGSGKNTWQ